MDTANHYQLKNGDQEIVFSKREAEVLVDVYEGLTARESGEHLTISPRTIEFYRNNIKLKMNCRTKIELVRKAKDRGIDRLMEQLNIDNANKASAEQVDADKASNEHAPSHVVNTHSNESFSTAIA